MKKATAAVIIATVAGSGGWSCASWPKPGPPKLLLSKRGSGPLAVGAAVVAMSPPRPVSVAGWAPPRPEVSQAKSPLRARAVVLTQGALTFGLVSIEIMNIPEDIAAEIRAGSGLTETWVVPTHTHSSFGSYDSRVFGQVFNVGRYRERARATIVESALEALRRARASAAPATIELAEGVAELSVPRSGKESDPRLTRVRFIRDRRPFAQWLILAAHATLVSRRPEALDGDYPSAVARESNTLVLQAAQGNAGPNGSNVDEFARKVTSAFDALEGSALEAPAMSVARVEVTLPEPDVSRMLPLAQPLAPVIAPQTAPIGAFRLGRFTLLALPGEISFAAAQRLERSGARVLSLANSYIGYVEPAEIFDERGGESPRQYYGRELLETLEAGALRVQVALE